MTTETGKIWVWNDRKYVFDVTEAGCMRRLMDAVDGLKHNLALFRQEQDTDDMLFCHCGILQEFFDDIFGDGAGELLCGTTRSAEVSSRAYLAFLAFVNDQLCALEQIFASAETEYRKKGEAMGLETECGG